MTKRVSHAGLQIDKELADFVANEAVKGLDMNAEVFWQACANVLNAHRDTNKALLQKREDYRRKLMIGTKRDAVRHMIWPNIRRF